MSDAPDPFATRKDPFPLPDWFTATEHQWRETGDPLLLPAEELSYSSELCERLFTDEQEAFNAGREIGEARHGAMNRRRE